VTRPAYLLSLLVLLALTACADPAASSAPTPTAEPPSAAAKASASPTIRESPPGVGSGVRVVAAGDIAGCEVDSDSATASLITSLGDDVTVAALGDIVYPSGTGATYTECYDPAWGALLERTRPAIGNHDVEADGGAAYHAYFGERAGAPGAAWYSYELGEWHVVVLDSNCELIGCGPGSAQHEWLVADLAASDARCTLAYQHHPRFSSGMHGDYPPVVPLWDALHAVWADLLLVGHDHMYERFAAQAPDGTASPDGIRQFTVGTGGHSIRQAVRVAPNSELIIDDAFGVLELTLHADAYDWRFLTLDGAVADAGTGACH
jgi:hypothetical protein